MKDHKKILSTTVIQGNVNIYSYGHTKAGMCSPFTSCMHFLKQPLGVRLEQQNMNSVADRQGGLPLLLLTVSLSYSPECSCHSHAGPTGAQSQHCVLKSLTTLLYLHSKKAVSSFLK